MRKTDCATDKTISMAGYTRAAIKDALAKRSARQVRCDDLMERLINGPLVYVFCTALYAVLGVLAWMSFQ